MGGGRVELDYVIVEPFCSWRYSDTTEIPRDVYNSRDLVDYHVARVRVQQTTYTCYQTKVSIFQIEYARQWVTKVSILGER